MAESVEGNSIETRNLNTQQLILNKISEINLYFIAEIKERELMIKRLSKYIDSLDYFNSKVQQKSLTVLSTTSASVSIVSFATVIGTPAGIATASISLTFSLSTGLAKGFLKTI